MNQTELSPGFHKFNFACQLPIQLPTSFESKYGHIRYQIKVELERPWKFDLKFCFAFTVIKVLDLNYESPALRSPLKTETTKSFFLGLSGKPLFISAEIPISGFVAGQAVSISIKINNESNTDVEETKITLKKIIHYNAQTPRRKTRERIESAAEVRHAGVPAKAKGNIEALLNLPAVPPTNIAFCRVLQVSYEIHVVARVGGFHRSPVLRLPITMGTVPLQGYQYAPTSTVSLSNWNMQPSTSRTNAEAPVAYPLRDAPSAPMTQDLRKNIRIKSSLKYILTLRLFVAPPSYSEAMNMGSNEGDTDEGLNDEKPFSPLYPVFNFAPTAPPPRHPQSVQEQQPPAYYGFSTPQQNYQEKKGF